MIVSRDGRVDGGPKGCPVSTGESSVRVIGSLRTIDTWAADEQRQMALANAVRTGFLKDRDGVSGNIILKAWALSAFLYTFLSLYNVGPKTLLIMFFIIPPLRLIKRTSTPV
jgi:hypothetical protein